MNMNFKKRLAAALSVLILLGSVAVLASCGETTEPADNTDGEIGLASGDSDVAESETVELDNRFDNVHYGGEKPFRVYTSINVAASGMGNSNFLIEGTDEVNGGMVSDAVLERNIRVEELLGIKLEFTQININYLDIPADIRRLTASGLDEFDLVINDLFSFANLSIEGQFRNVLDEACVSDFERSYWYGDYEDIRLMDGYQYILAGDYFIDVMRSAHLLPMNKQSYEDNYQRAPDELYDAVLNYEWTYEKMNDIISGIYSAWAIAPTNSDYQRLGSLENEILRSMEGDACVLPYPMLFVSDRKYTTSTHARCFRPSPLVCKRNASFRRFTPEAIKPSIAH